MKSDVMKSVNIPDGYQTFGCNLAIHEVGLRDSGSSYNTPLLSPTNKITRYLNMSDTTLTSSYDNNVLFFGLWFRRNTFG